MPVAVSIFSQPSPVWTAFTGPGLWKAPSRTVKLERLPGPQPQVEVSCNALLVGCTFVWNPHTLSLLFTPTEQSYASVKQTQLSWEKIKGDSKGALLWKGTAVEGSLALQDVSDIIQSDLLNSFDAQIAGVEPSRLVTILGHVKGRGVQLNLACETSEAATRLFRALRRFLSLRSDPLLANEAVSRVSVLVSHSSLFWWMGEAMI